MNLRCIVIKISIGLLIPQLYFAQSLSFDTLQFTRHLKQNHLFVEQEVFNKRLQKIYINDPVVTDSLKLDLALLYFQLHLPDSSKNTLLSISTNCCYSERLNQQYLSMLLVNKQYSVAEAVVVKNFRINTSGNMYRKNMELSLSVLKRTLSKSDTIYDSLSVSPVLLDIKNRYYKYPNYSPAVAGLYSALVPGLGKLYIGYKYQALSSFILNMLLAAQATESYFRAGLTSPRFIITAGLFSIFYTGNIIGSVSMAKKKKKDYYNQLDHEIFNYYSSDINKLAD